MSGQAGGLALGFGGAFSGVHHDVFIIAGGTNFPDSLPWQGGKKAWYDKVYVLQKQADGSVKWLDRQFTLPGGPRAYGLSISTDKGLLCIGGQDENTVFSEVLRIKWNPTSQTIEYDTLPPLTEPLCMMSGAKLGSSVYIAGGKNKAKTKECSKTFFRYSLDAKAEVSEKLPSWPGKSRILSVATIQNNGVDNCFYLFSGLHTNTSTSNTYLTDAFSYNPRLERWKKLQDIPPLQEKPRSLIAAPTISLGAAHIMIFSGVSGQVNIPLEQLTNQIKNLERQGADLFATQIDSLRRVRKEIYQVHPGFPKEILQYHTITDAWAVAGTIPYAAPVGAGLHLWDETMILGTGEIYPGVRSKEIYQIQLVNQQKGLSWLNSFILLLYFIVLVVLGIKFSKKQKTEEDYFKGGGRIPWWAAALSIFGTGLSAITFMAVPAKTFAADWSYYMRGVPLLLVPLLINWLFIPFYRKLKVTTAYEYLHLRFNLTTRLIASLSFLIFQLGRIGVVLFLPSIALNIVTGFDIYFCILAMGGVSLLYTLMGGIEAVIWTDVIQVIVLMGGGFLCLILMISNFENGFTEVVEIGIEHEKFNILNMAFDFRQPTFWVVILGGFFSNLIVYSTDQTMVQRYLITSDIKSSQKSLWTSILISLFSVTIFFFMGTALFAFFKNNPEELISGMSVTDAVFPWYIISQLPDGISGLLIAGIFAAAMSSLSSSMNSAATAYTIDFHQVFGWKGTGLTVGRIATLAFGISGTLFALLLASTDIKSVWDEFLKLVGLITGGLGGVFMLGVISKRANGSGAVVGLLSSGFIQYWIASNQVVHLLLFTATGFIASIIIGYLASFFFPASNKPISGLTIYK